MKFLAGMIIAVGASIATITTIATVLDIGTQIERVHSNFEGVVILVLGAILWQVTRLLRAMK